MMDTPGAPQNAMVALVNVASVVVVVGDVTIVVGLESLDEKVVVVPLTGIVEGTVVVVVSVEPWVVVVVTDAGFAVDVVVVGKVVVVVGGVVVVVVVATPFTGEMSNPCESPVAALYVADSATTASSVHVPVPTNCTVRPLVTHEFVVSDVTDVVPSLSVLTTAIKVLPTSPPVGIFEIVNVVGVNLATVTDWSEPVRALYFADAATTASRVHLPAPTNCTASPLAVQVLGVVETTDVVPSLSVVTTAVKDLVIVADDGRFEMVNIDGTILATVTDWSEPVREA